MNPSVSEKKHRNAFKDRSGRIQACPVCAAKPTPLYTIERFAEPLAILRCPECALQMQARIPEDASHLYDADYYEGRAEYNYRDERRQLQFDRFVHLARLGRIARSVAPPADFLDVGAAFGGLVECAAEFGYRARGLDVSEFAVAGGRARGLDLRVGRLDRRLFSEGVLAPQSQDVVTMIEVFEHVEDPREALATLRELVRPGGLVVIQTANFQGRQARLAGRDYHYYLPGHFFYYSSRNLSALLAQYGFSRTRVHRPTDFGLLPKLQKSRGSFQSWRDYAKWLRIAWYHAQSRIAWGDFALTSSMVLYARRDSR